MWFMKEIMNPCGDKGVAWLHDIIISVKSIFHISAQKLKRSYLQNKVTNQHKLILLENFMRNI